MRYEVHHKEHMIQARKSHGACYQHVVLHLSPQSLNSLTEPVTRSAALVDAALVTESFVATHNIVS